MQTEVINLDKHRIVVLLFAKFLAIYNVKWLNCFRDDNEDRLKKLAMKEWEQGLACFSEEEITAGINHCRLHVIWPPSLPEFIKIIESRSGVPAASEVLLCAVRQDFSHPLTKLIYDKIGSWDFKHSTEKDLEKKIKSIYEQNLMKFREIRSNNRLELIEESE